MKTYDSIMTPSDDGHWVLKSEADREICHHKYKRCLAMARMCEERYNYLTCLENWQMTDKEYQQAIGDYWDRWHNRWLELADKFKDKEAK